MLLGALAFIQKGQVRGTHNRRACMIRCMNVDEARRVCKDRSRWRSVVSAYSHGKRREFMYVCHTKNFSCNVAMFTNS